MGFSTLSSWLEWIGTIHKKEMDLGLERIKKVAEHLSISSPCPVITVGGTNGKGSTVAALQAIFQAAGYRVGSFTSPFLFKHNEEVSIDGRLASDEDFISAFERIEIARRDISLTPFEFHTLAALLIFQQRKLDLWILEVGLGGRLDAVNIIDADIAVITSISLDHIQWLGDTREAIAQEKAGIFRPYQRIVCGDVDPPEPLVRAAEKLQATLYCQNKDFYYREHKMNWDFFSGLKNYKKLPLNGLALQNMSTTLMTLQLMQNDFEINTHAVSEGLKNIKLMGRIQIVEDKPLHIFDVSHNPAAVLLLAKYLKKNPIAGKQYAVFSMLEDKDILGSVTTIQELIDVWFIAPLHCKRAASLSDLLNFFQRANISKVTTCKNIKDAYLQAKQDANPNDRIIVFGSFYTVSSVMEIYSRILQL